jgi:hypothetical protein
MLNAGLGSFIPLRTGYFDGAEVKYWDFGDLTSLALKPIYLFRYPADNEPGSLTQTNATHPKLIDSIPGDTAYTPLRQIYTVDFNTRLYRGERITSIRALEDAVEMGLVGSPQPRPFFATCLVAPSSVQMQADDEGQMVGPEITYYRGKIVRQFCVGDLDSKVGAFAQTDGKFKPGSAYSIRRRSDEDVLDETLLDIDLNDDGDLQDTNTIFNDTSGTKTYSGIWNSIEVEVDRNYKLGQWKKESDMFDRDGDILTAKPDVLDFHDRGVFSNRPIRYVAK